MIYNAPQPMVPILRPNAVFSKKQDMQIAHRYTFAKWQKYSSIVSVSQATEMWRKIMYRNRITPNDRTVRFVSVRMILRYHIVPMNMRRK